MRVRYTIGSLLLLQFIFAIGIAFVIVRIQKRQAAYNYLESRGFMISYDYDSGSGWINDFLVRRFGEEGVLPVRSISLLPPHLSNVDSPGDFDERAVLRSIAAFPETKELGLCGATWFDDADLGTVIALRNLILLDLSGTKISNGSIKRLSDSLVLKRLDIDNTVVDDSSVPFIRRMKSLEQLSIVDTKLTDEGISKIIDAIPSRMVRVAH